MATTKEQVWAAADELATGGRPPTLAAVRERLGKGSYTDISAAMQLWRAQRQASAAPLREPAPAALTERLAGFAAELWAEALELANARLQGERESLEQARAETERTRREAAELADQLAADLDQARAQLAAQAGQLAAVQADSGKLRGALATGAEHLAAATHRAETAEAGRAEAQRRADQFGALLDRERDAHALAGAEARRQAERAAAALAELEMSRAEIERLREELRAQGATLAETARRADMAEAGRDELHGRAGQLSALWERERDARDAAEAEAKTLAGQNAELRAGLAAAERRAAELEARATAAGEAAAREIDQLRRERADAEARARQAAETAAELRGRTAAVAGPDAG